MMTLSDILTKSIDGNKLHYSQEKISHLMYMNDIKLLDKNKKEVETLIQAVRIYREDKGTEFAIDKCAMQIMKSVK